MREVQIIVQYSSATALACEEFARILSENVQHLLGPYHTVEEVVLPLGDSYWNGRVVLPVEPDDLNIRLDEVEVVRMGFAEDSDEAMEGLFPDVSVEVFDFNEDEEDVVICGLNRYLHTKSQEQTRAIETLQEQVNQLSEQLEKQNEIINLASERFRQLFVYIHEVVNIQQVASTVRELAEKIDDSMLKDYQTFRIH